jgi:hypothetical protein
VDRAQPRLNQADQENDHRVLLASLESETDAERNTTMAEDRMAVLGRGHAPRAPAVESGCLMDSCLLGDIPGLSGNLQWTRWGLVVGSAGSSRPRGPKGGLGLQPWASHLILTQSASALISTASRGFGAPRGS